MNWEKLKVLAVAFKPLLLPKNISQTDFSVYLLFTFLFLFTILFLWQELFAFGNVTALGGNDDDEDRHQLQEKLAAVKRSWAGQVGLATS